MSQGQGPVCEWLVCEYTTSREVSLSPFLPYSLPSSLNPSSARFLPPLFPSRRPCPVPSFPRSFPSSTLPPSTLSSSTDAISLHNIIPAPCLPVSLPPCLPASLPASLPPSLPTSLSSSLPPSIPSIPHSLPPHPSRPSLPPLVPSLPPSSPFLLPTLHPSSLLPCHLPV